ncbi:hypothetical protein E2C01_016892 [Portunus trituberculatus]|uniref:Uncharacterized protein n=1 Tax=Portunus trituberculatus TaxID=210409 RepID=A0A5B7DRQ0_PORTR|nr:hypothetical protein [Portunus trituberculatus]
MIRNACRRNGDYEHLKFEFDNEGYCIVHHRITTSCQSYESIARATNLQVVDVDEEIGDAHVCAALCQVTGEARPAAVVERRAPLPSVRRIHDLQAKVEGIGQNVEQTNVDP